MTRLPSAPNKWQKPFVDRSARRDAAAFAATHAASSAYRELIDGSRQGLLAGAARLGLHAAALFYATGVQLRNVGFDWGLLPIRRAGVPVVSIGNLTAGGTGKTPMVAAIADWFTSRNVRPVILSRGYRSLENAVNDEKLVLDQLCPDVAHLQSPNRVKSAQAACATHRAQVLILDDGFQHRRLARDLDIVLIDALDPWGAGYLLPRGLLREPKSALKRADLIVLTRADHCEPGTKERILSEIRRASHSRPLIEASFEPVGLTNASGAMTQVESIAGSVVAFCGIGNPEGFRKTLRGAGMESRLVEFRTFPDHHHYTTTDLDDLARWARNLGADTLITTQKDLVKIPQSDLAGSPLWALTIRARITAGQDQLDGLLERLVVSS
jgi:tetraacyldisaccharide 4'-kinase